MFLLARRFDPHQNISDILTELNSTLNSTAPTFFPGEPDFGNSTEPVANGRFYTGGSHVRNISIGIADAA
jgi:hypothetical protein